MLYILVIITTFTGADAEIQPVKDWYPVKSYEQCIELGKELEETAKTFSPNAHAKWICTEPYKGTKI